MYLVTGGSGFLGQVVCEQLSSKGEQVIDFSLEATPSDRHINISGDIRSQSDLNVLFSTYPIHTVIHLASLLHTYSCSHPEEAFWTNTAGSVQLIDIARKHGVRRFLFGGTIDSIGEQPDIDGPVDEDVEARPGDFYSESKRIVEKVGAAYRSVYSFSFTAARIPVLVGPGIPTMTSAWRMEIFNLLKGGGDLHFPFFPGEVIPIAHVDDVARSLIAIAAGDCVNHPIYHLPCESWPIEDLGKAVSQLNPEIRVSFGTRRVDFCPPKIDFQRFIQEYGSHSESIAGRLQSYAMQP